MKEATGELSTTAIAVVAIAAVAAIFTLFILPGLKTSLRLSTACTSAGKSEYHITESDYQIDCVGGQCTLTDENSNKHTKTCEEN